MQSRVNQIFPFPLQKNQIGVDATPIPGSQYLLSINWNLLDWEILPITYGSPKTNKPPQAWKLTHSFLEKIYVTSPFLFILLPF